MQATTFSQVLETDSDGSEEKAIAALGILNTMETILTVMEEQKEVRKPFIISKSYTFKDQFSFYSVIYSVYFVLNQESEVK